MIDNIHKTDTSAVIPRLIICQRLVVEKDREIAQLKKVVFKLEENIRVLTAKPIKKKYAKTDGLSPVFKDLVFKAKGD